MPLNNFYPRLPDTIIEENCPLSHLTTLGTGGTAEFFAQPETVSQLQEIIRSAKNIPVYIIGGGSNILIPDGKIPGLVISSRKLDAVSWRDDFTAEIGAGLSLPGLVKTLHERNIGGLEFAAGVPGTLGGAISGNAGAGGHGVCEHVDTVNAVDSSGNLAAFSRGDFSYGYRHCDIRGVIIVSAVMSWDGSAWNEEEYSAFIDRRKSQPLKFRSAGCTFKNPEGHSAGKLLDECGCKGLRFGGAVVSDIHANFIINAGNATSHDVWELAGMCADRVFDCTGIKLEPEIKALSPCFSLK